MPLDAPNAATHGLFTFALCEILQSSSKGITYAELAQRIRTYYSKIGRTAGPTPLVEGLAQNREVLGTSTPGRSHFTLKKDSSGDWSVNAGQIHGLTERSILAVYPPCDAKGKDPDAKLGYVKIIESDTLKATVAPCAYGNLPEPAAADLDEPAASRKASTMARCG